MISSSTWFECTSLSATWLCCNEDVCLKSEPVYLCGLNVCISSHWCLFVGRNLSESNQFYQFFPGGVVFKAVPPGEPDQSSCSVLWLTAARVGSFDRGSFNPITERWIHHLLDNNFLASLETANDINVPALSSAPCVDSFSSCVCSPLNRSSGSLLSGASSQM